MFQADPPPAQAAPLPAASEVVVARSDHSAVVASLDLPLSLAKAGRREALMVRRALFVTAQVVQVRAASATDASADRYRWKLTGYLQRQYCVTSLAGVFACTEPQVSALPDKAEGQGPVTAVAGDYPLAITAERDLAESLHTRADALFAADRTAVVDPLLKAAGVKVVAPGGGARRR
ncbi:MAG: hypothetical protein JSS35_20775 [Proteobacteria bacterium]|nr:hypothetical protein [Pseudomonadota bacterium]